MPAETLMGVCPSCRELVIFRYIGEQYGHEDGVLYLYICGECKSTISGRRILTEDEMVEYLRRHGWIVFKLWHLLSR